MIIRKTPRKKKAVNVGKHTGKVRLKGKALTELRRLVFERAEGICEIRRKGCEGYAGWDYGQMHHKQHRSLGGSDSLGNCAWSCPECHRKEHGVQREDLHLYAQSDGA